MEVAVEYSGRKIPLKIDNRNVLDILKVPRVRIGDEDALVRKALRPLREFLGGGRIVVIVNDHTRPTPNDRVLEQMLPLLEGRDVKYIVALGSHKPPDEDGLKQIFGGVYSKVKENIVLHDCRNNLEAIGTTSRGTVVRISKIVLDADSVVAINAVEAHYFAGFSGGRKSIVPGVAAYDTIEQNHRWALDKGSYDTALEGNPVHEDMTEAALLFKKPLFAIQLVFTEEGIIAVESGGIIDSFQRAVKHAKKITCVPIREKADVVIAVAPYPKDIDLYQAQQALEKGKLALKNNGTIILIGECRNGIGNDEFYRLLSSFKSSDEVLAAINRGYKLGYHKAARIADLARRAKIFLVSTMEGEIARNCFMIPYRNPQRALDDALREKRDAKVTFLLNGFLTVPVVDSIKLKQDG